MLKKRLAGRRQMRTAEFFEFFREYLHSEYDLMGSLNIQDFLWLREHMADYHLFEPANQMLAMQKWLTLMSDVRPDVDVGMVVNLIKSIYAMREHKDTLVEESLDHSIDFVLKALEGYLTGNEREDEK